MKRHSIARRLISSVLLVELVFAVAVIGLAGAYERHTHLRSFDVMLRGRADSLLGSVQDAEDAGDNVMLDRTGLQMPAEDVYEVRDSAGRLLGRSANWQGPDPAETTKGVVHIFSAKLRDVHYRVISLRGLRVVDPGDKEGGKPRQILVVYGAPTRAVWRQVRNAMFFFSLSNLVLLVVTGLLMAWLLHRGLQPLRDLAVQAEGIDVKRWNFQPPESATKMRELAPLSAALTAAMQRLEASFLQQRRFVSDAAHELKTAVTVVKSSLQLLNMRQRTPAEYEEGVEVSLADCQRMEEIVGRMLTLARFEHLGSGAAKGGVADLSASAAAAVQQLQSMAEVRSITLQLSADEGVLVPLPAEECDLLCSNLLLNALQHSQPGSAVGVQVRRIASSSSAELRVIDQGDGIQPNLLPHVFERFSRGDPSRSRNTGGTGLGLAICKAIVDRAGGVISLESEPGHGTTAIVQCTVMPASPQSSEGRQPAQAHSSA